ncbi:MAG: hypothetical protein ABI680_12690, partial [Chthoniobacteraceae bacterium]
MLHATALLGISHPDAIVQRHHGLRHASVADRWLPWLIRGALALAAAPLWVGAASAAAVIWTGNSATGPN